MCLLLWTSFRVFSLFLLFSSLAVMYLCMALCISLAWISCICLISLLINFGKISASISANIFFILHCLSLSFWDYNDTCIRAVDSVRLSLTCSSSLKKNYCALIFKFSLELFSCLPVFCCVQFAVINVTIQQWFQ